MTAAHAWYVRKVVVHEQLRYTPSCKCGWAGRSCLTEEVAAQTALDHVRQARVAQ